MNRWPKHPKIYEINTWVWLNELSRNYKRLITLSTVPAGEWDTLSSLGVDALWFMGVWERSPKGIQVALGNEGLMADFRRALPDLQPEDIVGSPYCVRRYVVDKHLGGPEGSRLHEKCSVNAGCGLFSISCRTTWLLIIPGSSSIQGISSAGMTGTSRGNQRPSSRRMATYSHAAAIPTSRPGQMCCS
jgi:hypothetical protein